MSNTYSAIIEELKRQPALAEKSGVTPLQLEALYALASELYHAECYDKAADLFRLLCFYQHDHVKSWMGLGGAHQHLNNHEAALSAFMMASLYDPENPQTRLYTAHSLIDLENLPLALKSAQLAVQLSIKSRNDSIRQNAESLCSALINYLKNRNTL